MLKLVLLFLTLLAARGAESSGLRCPELSPADNICADAGEGFTFNDGCNQVRCLSGGLAASTRRQCPTAETAKELDRCRSVAFGVFDRMPPRQCQNVDPEQLCARYRGGGGGFEFTDGCNQIGCAADGSVAGVTLRACPAGRPDSALCQFVESLNADIMKSGAADGSVRRRRGGEEFACPQLASDRICGRSTNGFTYSDGCNTVTCHADGSAQSTFKACPEPDGAAATAYCEAAERQMRAKMQRSSLRNRCLQPDQVCVGDAVTRRLAFNDGCNRCICMARGEAGCSRRSCPKVLMTDDEFQGYCQKRGAALN